MEATLCNWQERKWLVSNQGQIPEVASLPSLMVMKAQTGEFDLMLGYRERTRGAQTHTSSCKALRLIGSNYIMKQTSFICKSE